MKAFFKHMTVSFGLSVLGVAVAGSILGASMLYISLIYQLAAVNILLHLGLFGIHLLEIENSAWEVLAELSFIMLANLLAGATFSWFATMPLPAVCIITVVVYVVAKAFGVVQMDHEAGRINQALEEQRKKREQLEQAINMER